MVGDLAEAIALILPTHQQEQESSLRETLDFLKELTDLPTEVKKARITSYWMSTPVQERFVFNKLITGNFRMGVSKQLVIKALAKYLDQEQTSIAHQLMGKWDPYEESMSSMFEGENHLNKHHLPYPFFLAYPLDEEPDTLGDSNDWYIEKKLDGIRGQIIVRNDELFVWSRGEELLTDKFPEFHSLQSSLPNGTVLDGEIIPWRDGSPLPFQVMQTRIGRKNISQKYLKEAPLVMVCFDILEYQGLDLRQKPLADRRIILKNVIESQSGNVLLLSEAMDFTNWQDVGEFRENAKV